MNDIIIKCHMIAQDWIATHTMIIFQSLNGFILKFLSGTTIFGNIALLIMASNLDFDTKITDSVSSYSFRVFSYAVTIKATTCNKYNRILLYPCISDHTLYDTVDVNTWYCRDNYNLWLGLWKSTMWVQITLSYILASIFCLECSNSFPWAAEESPLNPVIVMKILLW